MKLLLLAIPFLITAGSGHSIKRYDGFQIYKIQTYNKEQMNQLLHLQKKISVDYLNGPSLYASTSIIVSPKYKKTLESFLIQHGYNYHITIPNVQKAIDDQAKDASQEKNCTMNWKSYHKLETIYDWIESLASNYPQLAKVISIGTSYEGRDMKLIHISSGPKGSKPAVFFDGGIHAREWISPATLTYIINQLVTNFTHNKEIVDAVDWYILPVLNVDGYEYTHTVDRMWRKTRSNFVPSSGCRGADANRNYDFHFDTEGGASSDPCSSTYKGIEPFSEPETKAMSNFILKHKNQIKLYINFHSYSQLWLLPWGYTKESPPDIDNMKTLAVDAADALFSVHKTKYTIGPIPELLDLVSGCASDWAKGVAGIKYAYAIELSDTGQYGFALPTEFIIPSGEEIFAAVRVLAKHCNLLDPISISKAMNVQAGVTISLLVPLNIYFFITLITSLNSV